MIRIVCGCTHPEPKTGIVRSWVTATHIPEGYEWTFKEVKCQRCGEDYYGRISIWRRFKRFLRIEKEPLIVKRQPPEIIIL